MLVTGTRDRVKCSEFRFGVVEFDTSIFYYTVKKYEFIYWETKI